MLKNGITTWIWDKENVLQVFVSENVLRGPRNGPKKGHFGSSFALFAGHLLPERSEKSIGFDSLAGEELLLPNKGGGCGELVGSHKCRIEVSGCWAIRDGGG